MGSFTEDLDRVRHLENLNHRLVPRANEAQAVAAVPVLPDAGFGQDSETSRVQERNFGEIDNDRTSANFRGSDCRRGLVRMREVEFPSELKDRGGPQLAESEAEDGAVLRFRSLVPIHCVSVSRAGVKAENVTLNDRTGPIYAPCMAA